MLHFPSNIAQHEAYGEYSPMALPVKCGKVSPNRTVALEKVTCKACQSKIFGKGL